MNEILPQARPSLAARARLQVDAITSEPVLLFPEGILILNPTAQAIVLLCDGKNTVDDLVRRLHDEYDESEQTLQCDVRQTLADLQQRNLIVISP